VHTIDVLQTDTSHTCKNPIPNTSFLVLNHHTSVSIRDTLFIAVQKSPEQSSSAVITLINPKLVGSCNFTIPSFPLTSDLLLPTEMSFFQRKCGWWIAECRRRIGH
jgi:hypothetical protein